MMGISVELNIFLKFLRLNTINEIIVALKIFKKRKIIEANVNKNEVQSLQK